MLAVMGKEEPIGRTIGLRLDALRRQMGLTQGQLAVKSKTDQSTLSQLLSGYRKNPPIGTVTQVGLALGVTPDQLLGLKPLPEAPQASEPAEVEDRLAKVEARLDEVTQLLSNTVKRQRVILSEEVGKKADSKLKDHTRKKINSR